MEKLTNLGDSELTLSHGGEGRLPKTLGGGASPLGAEGDGDGDSVEAGGGVRAAGTRGDGLAGEADLCCARPQVMG
jgi:hypothetical protein